MAQRLGSSIKRSSTTSNGNHLQVPGPQHKTRNIDHAQRNNMAFDISDEQVLSFEDTVDMFTYRIKTHQTLITNF